MDYEVVIGLETHCELLTEGKLWCRCSTKFGQAPNTQTCPVCLGMPGVLPVLNEHAFELALRAALAMNCRINRTCYFDRKNYYYPDLPKNYQVSQSYRNLGEDGFLEIPVESRMARVGITNVHLEEDAGKNMHAEQAGADYSLVDLNRAGTPLLEIVSEPDMRTVAEAESYMHTLRQILLYTGVSDCKMQEGSLRFEASISLRPFGQKAYGARVEIKNVNSMKAVCAALAYEIKRQTKVLDRGEKVDMETRLWDDARGHTARMRSKEEAQDYRYFPDPDLLPVQIDDAMLERVRASLTELPLARRRRFVEQYSLTDYEAQVLTDASEVADYFEGCLNADDGAGMPHDMEEFIHGHEAPKAVANWIMNEILREVKDRAIGIEDFEIAPARLAELVRLQDEGRINAQAARDVMAKMIETGRDAEALVEELGLEQISDQGALDPIIEQVIAENPGAVADYTGGKMAAVGALVGQVMRLSKGKADPKLVNRMLRQRLDGAG